MNVVLVVTPFERLLGPITDHLASAGYTAFAAVPSIVPSLRRWTSFDLVVVTRGVGDDALARHDAHTHDTHTIDARELEDPDGLAEIVRSTIATRRLTPAIANRTAR